MSRAGYTFAIESLEHTYPDFEPLYRRHYAEMRDRLTSEGIEIADYNPNLQRYAEANRAGYLIHYTARLKGEPVGYSNIYLTNDMHNGELIAREDTIYVKPGHRNGVGRRLAQTILADLKERGCKRLLAMAVTDLRVARVWERMGFKHAGYAMVYPFPQEA